MGADLMEAKRVCRDEGKLFEDWCGSSECPVGYHTATRLMSVARRLGSENSGAAIFEHSFQVLSEVTRTTDEDQREALLEHLETNAAEGKKITQKEVEALKKALNEAKKKAEALGEEDFNLKARLASLAKGIAAAKEAEAEAKAKKDEYVKMLFDADKKRKELEQQLKSKKQEIEDAQEVAADQLVELEKRIRTEERGRPQTPEEVVQWETRIKELQDAHWNAQAGINTLVKEREALAAKLADERAAVLLRDEVLSKFQQAARQFRQDSLAIVGATMALRQIPMTEGLYQQIEIMRDLAGRVLTALQEVTDVNQVV